MNKLPLTWKSNCGQYTVIMAADCLNKMIDTAVKHLPNEVGTSLIGYYSKDGYQATITGLSPLTGDSQGSRFSFIRGTKGLKEFYLKLMSDYNGSFYYVGEWHSHPFGNPYPSSTDDENQLNIAKDSKVKCPECILSIIGGDFKNEPLLKLYIYSKTKGRIDLVPSIE